MSSTQHAHAASSVSPAATAGPSMMASSASTSSHPGVPSPAAFSQIAAAMGMASSSGSSSSSSNGSGSGSGGGGADEAAAAAGVALAAGLQGHARWTPTLSSKGAAASYGDGSLPPATLLAQLQAATQGLDAYSALLAGTEHIASTQLTHLLEAGERFFHQYDQALRDDTDPRDVAASHAALLAAFDQVLESVAHVGLAGLSVDGSHANPEPEMTLSSGAGAGAGAGTDTDTAMASGDGKGNGAHEAVAAAAAAANGEASAKGTDKHADRLVERLAAQSHDAFERRERMREGAAIVTSILAASHR